MSDVPRLVMTVGLPRSGKSTWAKAQGVPIVNPDAIRLAVHGQRYRAEAEPLVWSIAQVMVRALFGAGHETVILDATNMNEYRRDQWRSTEWTRAFKIFDTPVDVCLARAAGDTELQGVIKLMDSTRTPVSAIEHKHQPFIDGDL